MRWAGYAVFAAALGLNAAAADASPLAPAYRADQSFLRIEPLAARASLPSRLEEFEPRSELLPAAPPADTQTAAHKPVPDLWARIRAGSALPELDGPLVSHWQSWYLERPQLLMAMFERSRRYLYHVVEELEKRGLPSELVYLPMVESAYNPMALSPAQASGLWQFIPSTGKDYKLEQNHRYDARRDIIASTSAALDYLQALHRQFGDWQLALAAYNWGENAVAKAIGRNQAKGRRGDYAALALPEETRNYLPKLQALKNIVANPEAFKLELEPVPNRPYFATLASARDLDVKVAAKLAGMPLEAFLALNPAHNLPTIPKNTPAQIVLPVENMDTFVSNLQNYKKPPAPVRLKKSRGASARITYYLVEAGDTLGAIAARFGVRVNQLKAWNPLAAAGLQAGQKLHLRLQ
jgi:membrane-bound lytic murein transglycosylase D